MTRNFYRTRAGSFNLECKGYFHSTTSMHSFLRGFLSVKQQRALTGLSGALTTLRGGLLAALFMAEWVEAAPRAVCQALERGLLSLPDRLLLTALLGTTSEPSTFGGGNGGGPELPTPNCGLTTFFRSPAPVVPRAPAPTEADRCCYPIDKNQQNDYSSSFKYIHSKLYMYSCIIHSFIHLVTFSFPYCPRYVVPLILRVTF